MTAWHHTKTEVRVGGPRILGQNLLMRGRRATHMRCIDACPFWKHAKHALLIVIFKRAHLHASSVGITTLVDLESHNRCLTAEALSRGLDGGWVGVLDGVKLPIMVEKQFNKQLKVPGMPSCRPLPEDTVELTWIRLVP